MNKFSRSTEGGNIVVTPQCEVKMVGGDLQLRYKLPTGGKVSISQARKEGNADSRGHYHKGLTEVYTVHEGWLKLLLGDLAGLKVITLEPAINCSFTVNNGIPHGIIKGPGTVFVTQTIGTPQGNKDRKNNDWYLASESFNALMLEYVRIKGY
jgi:hypothetical protein